MAEEQLAASGQPTKSFFVDMITLDLNITDCILDLIDNAIDKAVALKGVDVTDL